MRKGILIAAVLVLGLASLSWASSPWGAQTFAPKDCTEPRVEPTRIVFACGDGSYWIDSLHWAFWRDNRAKGGGQFNYKTCNPSCAEGPTRHVHAVIRLKRPRMKNCGGRRERMFTRAALRFPNRKPPNAEAYRHPELYCIP